MTRNEKIVAIIMAGGVAIEATTRVIVGEGAMIRQEETKEEGGATATTRGVEGTRDVEDEVVDTMKKSPKEEDGGEAVKIDMEDAVDTRACYLISVSLVYQS